MIHLYFIPIIIVAAITSIISNRYDLEVFGFISKIAIFISVVLFIYFFLDYKGLNLALYVRNLLRI